MIYFLLVIFIITSLISNLVFATKLNCSTLLEQQQLITENSKLESYYERLETLEKKYFYLMEKLNSKFGKNVEVNKNLESLIQAIQNQIGIIEAVQESLLLNQPISDNDISNLEETQNELFEQFQSQDFEKIKVTSIANIQLKPHLDMIIESPELAQADTPYQVDMDTKEITSVIISQSLIKEVFNDLNKSRTISRSLKKIKKGVFGSSYTGDGIIRMARDSQIIEIRASGREGNFRFFGYIEKNQLFLVHYTLSSDHSAGNTKKNADKVSNIRSYRTQ